MHDCKAMAKYTGIGLMSGTSLDGLDICCVEFTREGEDEWRYRIIAAETVEYIQEWKTHLLEAPSLPGQELIRLHVKYGHFLGECTTSFITKHGLDVDFVASHGHTIFHQPKSAGFTFQVGCGETAVTHLHCPLVTDFRTKDVALGGEGAPLAPSGEEFLFKGYKMCLNLGGICNISLPGSQGFDICSCNMLLNTIASFHGKEYDDDGKMAASGVVDKNLLSSLNRLPFFNEKPPKSLGREWFENDILPLLNKFKETTKVEDLMVTATEHISYQITEVISKEFPAHNQEVMPLLVTGGGAKNKFLVRRLQDMLETRKYSMRISSIDEMTIDYKEALIFAFLGLRALLGLSNVSSKVTGAGMSSLSGSIHMPPNNLNKYFINV